MPVRDKSFLFPKSGAWTDSFTEQQQDWWEWIITSAIEDKERPSVLRVLATFRREFPECDIPAESTVRRSMVLELKNRLGEDEAWIDEPRRKKKV